VCFVFSAYLMFKGYARSERRDLNGAI